jgi:hypothetical protein
MLALMPHRPDKGATIMTTTSPTSRTRPSRWPLAAWLGLLLLAAFYLFGAANDLLADGRTGLPTDHTTTFAAVTGTSWAAAQHATPGLTTYVTLLERGYALHELVFGLLFVIILAIPFRRRQRWAWFACWTPTIANLGYALTFGVHDSKVGYRSLIALIALPVLLLILIPAFFGRSEAAPVRDACGDVGDSGQR